MAVPPTRPNCFRNFPTSGNRRCCSGVNISLCGVCMALEVQVKVVQYVWVVISAPPRAHTYVAIECLCGTLDAHDTDDLLYIPPVAIVEDGLDDRLLAQGARVLHIPHKLLMFRDELR